MFLGFLNELFQHQNNTFLKTKKHFFYLVFLYSVYLFYPNIIEIQNFHLLWTEYLLINISYMYIFIYIYITFSQNY